MGNIKKTIIKDFYINNELNIKDVDNVRIVGDNIESHVVTFAEAKKIASDMEKDVVGLNLTTNPPILKIVAYDKFMYELKKNAKKNKVANKPLKEIDLSVNIAQNDLETKVKKAKQFIEDGSKVKVVLTMRGRELSRKDFSKKSLEDFIEMMTDVATLDNQVKDEGNKAIVIFKKK